MQEKELKFDRSSFWSSLNTFLMSSLVFLIGTMLFQRFLQAYTEEWRLYGAIIGISAWSGCAVNYWRFWKNTVFKLTLKETTFVINDTQEFPYNSIVKIDERLPHGFYLWGSNYIFNFISKSKDMDFLESAIISLNSYYRRSRLIEENEVNNSTTIDEKLKTQFGSNVSSPNPKPVNAVGDELLLLMFSLPLLFLFFSILGPWIQVNPYVFKGQLLQRMLYAGFLFLFTFWLYKNLAKAKVIQKKGRFKFLLGTHFLLTAYLLGFNTYLIQSYSQKRVHIKDLVQVSQSRTPASTSAKVSVILDQGTVVSEIHTRSDETYRFMLSNLQKIQCSPSSKKGQIRSSL